MAGLDDILRQLPIDQIAARLGVEPDVAERAVQEGGATILTGLQRNAQTPEGAESLQRALGQHTGEAGQIDLDAVDEQDGQKILNHVFAGNQDEVAQRLTGTQSLAGINFGQLLPLLAPIIMKFLANRQGATAQQQGPGGLGDLLGSILGGGSRSGGVDLGGILGGLFGDQRR